MLSAFQGLRGRGLYVRAVQTGRAIPMQEFISADLKHRMRVDPNTHNNKLATYHSWFAIPFSRNERVPTIVPRYLHLNLSKHVVRNVSNFRLRSHTLKVEVAAWLEDGSRVYHQCLGEDEHVLNEVHAHFFALPRPSSCELRKHSSFGTLVPKVPYVQPDHMRTFSAYKSGCFLPTGCLTKQTPWNGPATLKSWSCYEQLYEGKCTLLRAARIARHRHRMETMPFGNSMKGKKALAHRRPLTVTTRLWFQLKHGLRSRQILPSDIAVPPGPGGRYRNMNTTFQRNNEQAPEYV